MRNHFVVRYEGIEKQKLENFFNAGMKTNEYFSNRDFSFSFTESGMEFSSLDRAIKVKVTYDKSSLDEPTELGEVDILGDKKEVKSIKKDLEDIFKSNGFSIL